MELRSAVLDFFACNEASVRSALCDLLDIHSDADSSRGARPCIRRAASTKSPVPIR